MRLELTTRSDLALRAIRLLNEDGSRMKRALLADQLGTSPDFLARIIGPLVHRGWVVSETGPAGGYQLDPSVRSLSVYDLISSVEGVPDDDQCVLPRRAVRSGRSVCTARPLVARPQGARRRASSQLRHQLRRTVWGT